MSSLPCRSFCGGVLALFLLAVGPAVAAAQMAPSANLGQTVASSVRSLQASLQSLTPGKWKSSGAEKQEWAAAQESLQRNLGDAIPGLLQTWNRAPQNLSEAFRLYRDLDAVYQVTSRLAASAGQYAPADQAQSITASSGQLKQSLQQLGDYIQAAAALQYTQVQKAREAAAAAPRPAPAPQSIVIDDANAAPSHTVRHKTVHRKVQPKKTEPKPASPQGGPQGGMD